MLYKCTPGQSSWKMKLMTELKNYNKKLCHNSNIRIMIKIRFFTYICIGIIDTLIDIFVLYTLIFLIGNQTINLLFLNPISYTVSVICSFFLNGKFTFKDNNLSFKKFTRLYASSFVGVVLNTLIVFILITVFKPNIILAKVIAACVVVFYNYTMCKKFIFRSQTWK